MASKYADDDEPAGSKYADDGDLGESKYAGGGGGGSEAKGGGSTPSGDVGAILPPIVQAFAHHVMSKKYRDCVETFFKENCSMFRGVDPKAEQLLEYTDVYQGYVKLVEEQLDDFCIRHQVTSEDVFNEVQDVVKVGDLDDEFLPAILRVAEYSYFMEQMVLTADHDTHVRDAMEITDNESKDTDELASITGVWRVDKKRTDFNGLDQYLAAIRVPAVFRGLAKGTFFSNKELLVLQRRSNISVIANSPFGWQRLDYSLDDIVHDIANPWGAEVPVRAALDMRGRDGVEVVIEHCRPSHLPRGSSVVHTWCGIEGGKVLRCTMEVKQPGRDTVIFQLFYTRGSPADLAASKKKGGNKSGSDVADAKAEAK